MNDLPSEITWSAATQFARLMPADSRTNDKGASHSSGILVP
jgi:hypothetical protein